LVNIAVTPFVGVWIEIGNISKHSRLSSMSLPSWECGLKFAHCTTIWNNCLSLPSWECGLKFNNGVLLIVLLRSLPSWECGLKLYVY